MEHTNMVVTLYAQSQQTRFHTKAFQLHTIPQTTQYLFEQILYLKTITSMVCLSKTTDFNHYHISDPAPTCTRTVNPNYGQNQCIWLSVFFSTSFTRFIIWGSIFIWVSAHFSRHFSKPGRYFMTSSSLAFPPILSFTSSWQLIAHLCSRFWNHKQCIEIAQ